MALPFPVDEVSPEWLTEALQESTPGIKVVAIEESKVIWGSGTKILLRVAYADGVQPNGPPAALCVKGGFNEEIRHIAAPNYLLEANFYADVAKT